MCNETLISAVAVIGYPHENPHGLASCPNVFNTNTPLKVKIIIFRFAC